MATTPDRLHPPLILASASAARSALLCASGLKFIAIPASVDEAAIKRQHGEFGSGAITCAAALAEIKARAVAARHPEAIVIGADQILVADGEWFDKPVDIAEATVQLRRLSGRRHSLATAACAVRGDEVLWTATAMPRLTMRRLGKVFVAEYIANEGEAVLGSVGAYRIEGRGVQLFTRIEGDYYAILGLPLLELLGFLRGRGLLRE